MLDDEQDDGEDEDEREAGEDVEESCVIAECLVESRLPESKLLRALLPLFVCWRLKLFRCFCRLMVKFCSRSWSLEISA